MNGLTVGQRRAFLPTIADTNWQIVGAGDVNGDGNADVIWRNRASGQNIGLADEWSDGGRLAAFLPTIADTNWEIESVGDLNGDGKADVVWRKWAAAEHRLADERADGRHRRAFCRRLPTRTGRSSVDPRSDDVPAGARLSPRLCAHQTVRADDEIAERVGLHA